MLDLFIFIQLFTVLILKKYTFTSYQNTLGA